MSAGGGPVDVLWGWETYEAIVLLALLGFFSLGSVRKGLKIYLGTYPEDGSICLVQSHPPHTPSLLLSAVNFRWQARSRTRQARRVDVYVRLLPSGRPSVCKHARPAH